MEVFLTVNEKFTFFVDNENDFVSEKRTYEMQTIRNGLAKLSFAILLLAGMAFAYLFVSSASRHSLMSSNQIISSSEGLEAYNNAIASYEKKISQSVSKTLEAMMGEDCCRVNVQAQMEFEKQSESREILDTENPALALMKSSETTDEMAYAFSKQTISKNQNGGVLKHLSVYVLVDNRKLQQHNIDLKTLENIVRQVSGYDEARMDKVDVLAVNLQSSLWQKMTTRGFMAILVFLIVFMVFVLIFVSFSSEKTIVEDRQYPAFVRPEIIKQAGLSSQIDGQPSNNVLQKTQSVLAKQPDKSLDILRQWLNESVSEDNV